MRKNLELLIGLLIGIAISITGTALAETLVNSEDVPYSNEVSSGTYDDVQDAIDELYKRANYLGYKYQEEILNGAYPVLGDGMIPIYLSDNGDAYYADLYTKWYSYKEKKWANAVILVDSAKDKYHTGDKILEEDIESYFVWIPRYAYKIWNLGNYTGAVLGSTLNDSDYEHSISKTSNNARIIDIQFGSTSNLVANGTDIKKQTRDENTGLVNDPEDIEIGNYLIHTAFTLGANELDGIWVGKFETGYNQTNNGESSITDTSNWTSQGAVIPEGNSNKIIIKPNVYAWRGSTVSKMFNTAYSYNTSLNSHMMKNTEWGAVAYLSHSSYGKGAEVNINNTSDYKSGYSAAPNTNQSSFLGELGLSSQREKSQPWNTATGYLASTTGNITGIYDMSGGAWEYVAATVVNSGTLVLEDKSGFEADEITEYMKLGYIDAYSTDVGDYKKRILGDATGEMGPFYSYFDNDGKRKGHNSWYNDAGNFIYSTVPWYGRGAASNGGLIGGQFFFTNNTGVAGGGNGSRLVLTGTARTS